ncbi:DUF397 domain-containing protein [Nocardia beijingensis]|uniref:DUF397 domain-containing protein n=1 Tax=Nocardia beijingensis TaxID=95162 RepID=UPI00339F3684
MSIDLTKAAWFKSSHSGPNQDCVEVAYLEAGLIGMRDSKNPAGPALLLPAVRGRLSRLV